MARIIDVLLKRRRFLAVFLIREHESYRITGKKWINAHTHLFKYKGGVYAVDLSRYTYSKKNKSIYFLDVAHIKQILIDESNGKPLSKEERVLKAQELDGTNDRFDLLSPRELSMYVTGSYMRNLITAVAQTSGLKLSIISIIVGLVAGVGVGWVIRDIITGGYFG